MGKSNSIRRVLTYKACLYTTGKFNGANVISILLNKKLNRIVDLVHLTAQTPRPGSGRSPQTPRVWPGATKNYLFHVACESVIITLAVTFNDIHTHRLEAPLLQHFPKM